MSADGAAAPKVVEMKLPENPSPAPPPIEKPPRSRRRFIIMGAVPALLLAIGGYFWLTGGRYASTRERSPQMKVGQMPDTGSVEDFG